MIRKLIVALAVLLVALVALAILTARSADEATPDEGTVGSAEQVDPVGAADSTADSAVQADTVDAEAVAAGVPVPSTAREAVVIRLADGDSFDIVWSDTDEFDEVRLVGINAPERDACFGAEARAELAELTDDRVLFVDGIRRDEFGRVLAEVWAGGVFVNLAMVAQGAALAISGDGPHAPLITGAQAAAEQTQIGLWSSDACGSAGGTLVIAAIEFDAPGRDNEQPNGEWIEIANRGAVAAELTGWSIRDESTRHRYTFPNGFVLGAGASVRVRSGCGQDSTTDLFWCGEDPIWNNSGDTGFLVDPAGQFADTFAYSS